MNNNNNISVTTEKVEELWTELSQAWSAVKNNPEIAKNIEELWKILKASGSDHVQISKEIRGLLGNSITSDYNQNSTSPTSINAVAIPTNSLQPPAATQDNDDIDHLLAEILGDDYKQDINHSFSPTSNNNEAKSTDSSDGSSTEELDKLVASILGEDGVKEELNITNNTSSDYKQAAKTIQSNDTSESDNLIYKTETNIDSLVASIIEGEETNLSETEIRVENQKLIDDKEDIDKLLNDILNEDDKDKDLTTTNLPSDNMLALNINEANNKISDVAPANILSSIASSDTNEESIDDLINDIINKDTDFEDTLSSISNTNNEEFTQTTVLSADENVDDLINDIINRDTDSENTLSNISNTNNEEFTQTTVLSADENIDDLINNIINKDADSENTISDISSIDNKEFTQATVLSKDENVDDLINDIINKDTPSENTLSSISSADNEEQIQTSELNTGENIDDLINDILKDKVDTNNIEVNELNQEEITITGINENTSHKTTTNRISHKVTPPPIVNKVESDTTTYKQPEKGSSKGLIIIILIILVLFLIAAWMLFFNKEESTQQNINIEETFTYTPTLIEEESPAVEETYTPATTYETEPVYTPSETYEPEIQTEAEYIPSTIEPSTYNQTDSSVTDYSTPIETDITITLNTPETAIEANDPTVFNENVTAIEIAPLVDDNINTIEKIVETTTPTETLGENELVLKESKIEKIKKTEKVIKEKPAKIIARRKVIIHVIVKGDTLWHIAKRYVNNPYKYPELARLSKIKNPDRIYPGKKVKIIVYVK